MSVIEACLQTRLELPKATARKNGKQMKQILQQIPQCSSSKGITIGLAWHFITEYYTPAKKSLLQNTETTSSMADHRKQMLHVIPSRTPRVRLWRHDWSSQWWSVMSFFFEVHYYLSCVHLYRHHLLRYYQFQLPVGLIVPLIALDSSTALVSLRSWVTNTYRSSPMFF